MYRTPSRPSGRGKYSVGISGALRCASPGRERHVLPGPRTVEGNADPARDDVDEGDVDRQFVRFRAAPCALRAPHPPAQVNRLRDHVCGQGLRPKFTAETAGFETRRPGIGQFGGGDPRLMPGRDWRARSDREVAADADSFPSNTPGNSDQVVEIGGEDGANESEVPDRGGAPGDILSLNPWIGDLGDFRVDLFADADGRRRSGVADLLTGLSARPRWVFLGRGRVAGVLGSGRLWRFVVDDVVPEGCPVRLSGPVRG